MIPESRNRRVLRNAGMRSMTRPNFAPNERRSPANVARAGGDWMPDERPAGLNDNVAPLALKHGRYEVADSIIRPSIIETEITPLVINRAVTVIDDWIDDDVFHRRHVRVIEAARDLWRAIKRPRHPFFDPYDPEELEDGPDSERAKNLLRRCRSLVGRGRWYIFENVIRWNEPTGIPGSRIANVSAASITAAQDVVRDVADEIGHAWIL